jgi:hypothetical protein
MRGEHADVTATDRLLLDRRLTNRNFQSWRLSRDANPKLVQKIKIPGEVCEDNRNSYDYLHTRISLLHNILMVSEDAVFTITRIRAGTLGLQKLLLGTESFEEIAGESLRNGSVLIRAVNIMSCCGH